MTENEHAALSWLFTGTYKEIALAEDVFICAESKYQKCKLHGFHLDQHTEKLDERTIC